LATAAHGPAQCGKGEAAGSLAAQSTATAVSGREEMSNAKARNGEITERQRND
jgi:hypothetical protein